MPKVAPTSQLPRRGPKFVKCPHCSTVVMPTSDGLCPACRKKVHDRAQTDHTAQPQYEPRISAGSDVVVRAGPNMPYPADTQELMSFKCVPYDQNGRPATYFSQRVILTAAELRIGEWLTIPLARISEADQVSDTIAIVYADNRNGLCQLSFVVTKKLGAVTLARTFKTRLDQMRSVAQLKLKREQLEREGRGRELRVVECAFCHTPLDLTAFDNYKQVHCHFCETIFTVSNPAANAIERSHYFCRKCGLYSYISDYATVKLSFIGVYLYWKHYAEKLCPACAQRAARNRFLFCTFLGVLAAPIGMVWNACAFLKAALGKKAIPDPNFARLDKANRLFRKRRYEQAAYVYMEVSKTSLPHAGVFTNMAYALLALGRKEEAAKALETAVSYCPNFLPNRELLARIYEDIANVHYSQGRYGEALKCCEEWLGISRRLGDEPGEAATLGRIGLVYYSHGRHDEAVKCYEEGLAIERRLGDEQGMTATLNNLGLAHFSQGRDDEAMKCYEESLAMMRKLGDEQDAAGLLSNIGIVHSSQGRYDEALKCYKESLAMVRKLGNKPGVAATLRNMASVHQVRNERDKGLPLAREAARLAHKLRLPDVADYDKLVAELEKASR